jgi:hypothetical protein
MPENPFPGRLGQTDDFESLMEEARSVDALLSGDPMNSGGAIRVAPDPSILLVLCRALENEACNGLESLKCEHLIKIHRSLAALKEDVERLLVASLEPVSA